MVAQEGIAGPVAVVGWSKSLGDLHARIAHRFARSEARERVRRYLAGLLSRVERKNGWQIAEAVGERDPQGVQRLLNSAKWDADALRDDLGEYVLEHLADQETGILIVDETGFLKKGEKSVGVARQYTGTAGDTVNCQVGAFLAYASKEGAAFLDRTLYLPKRWTNDPLRRAEAGVPEGIVFRNKIELAEEMLERAFAAGVPARWIVADSFYGRSHAFRVWLERQGRPYAVMVPKTNAVPLGGRKKRIEQHVERLPEEAFSEVRPARDGGGERPWEWACLDLAADPEKGMRRWLLVRRSTDDPEDRGYYQAYGPAGTPIEELVRVCQERWAVEECFAEAKGEVGLDHYEVRRWEAWHRYITLCLLAHAFLVAVRIAARDEEGARARGAKRGISTPISSRRPCRRRGSWSSRWSHRKAEDGSFWDGLCGGGRTRRWRPAAARRAWPPNAPQGPRPAQKDLPRRSRSRWRRRPSPTSNGRRFAPCCHRRGAA
jgi:SRSO17 transposase